MSLRFFSETYMLRWLKQKMQRRYLWVISGAFLVALVLVLPAHAQGWDPDGFTNSIMAIITNLFLGFGKFFIGGAIFFLKFFIALAQYNNYLNVPTVQIGWTMVRDVANMFFVVALLIIAFGTILGLEQYQWNKTLVKLVLAAVFINFSNLICGIFIDLAHVFTITFVNAVAGAAGGNLINMFKMDAIYKMVSGGATPQANTNVPLEVLIGAFASFIFSLMIAMLMGLYCMIMLGRVLVLWVLIILSPLAFIFQVIPETESRAKEWWHQFGNYVVAAPVMVFFLWLTFATMGTGDVVSTLNLKLGETELSEVVATQATAKAEGQAEYSGPNALSLNAVTTWENLASFLIPFVLLYIGIQKVQELSVVGGSALSNVLDYGKKAAATFSGYTAARWLGGKAAEGAKATGLGLAKGVGYVTGLHVVANRFKRELEGFHNWRMDTGYRPVLDYKYIDPETGEETEVYKKEKVFKRDRKTGELLKDDNGNYIPVLDSEGKQVERTAMEKIAPKFAPLQKLFFRGAQRDIASAKKLEKTQNMAKNRRELLDKRTSAVPTSLFMGKSENIDALDRIEQGMLKGEQMRSAAKTEEFHAMGEQMVLQAQRVQYKDGKPKNRPGSPTIAEQIAAHKTRAKLNQASVEKIEADAMKAFIRGEFTFGPFEKGHRDEATGLYHYGEHLLHDIEALEFGKKAADDFVAEVKEKNLNHAMESARQRVEELIKEGGEDPDKIEDLLQKESEINPFVASLRQGHLLAESKEEAEIVQKQASDAAYDAAVGLAQGARTPSTAMSDRVERIKKTYGVLERTQAQKLAADRIAMLSQKRKAQGGRLDVRDQLALMGAISAVDMEAWNDDVYDHVFAQIKKLDDPNFAKTNPGEYKKALAMKELADSMGWKISKDQDGKSKIETTYGRGMSAQFQGLAMFGGDVEALRASVAAEKVMDDDYERRQNEVTQNFESNRAQHEADAIGSINDDVYTDIVRTATGKDFELIADEAKTSGKSIAEVVRAGGYSSVVDSAINDYVADLVDNKLETELASLGEMDYEAAVQTAEKNGTLGPGMTAEKFFEKLHGAQDFMQTGAREYTRDAYGNYHYESSHNQQFDTGLRGGMLRMMTGREAEAETRSDLSKKKLSEIAQAQMHSFGEMDLNGGHLFRHISESMYRTLLGELKDDYQWNNVNQRTAKKLYGYVAGENVRKKNGRAVIGGANMSATFGSGAEDTKERGKHVLKDYILPQILGNHRSFLIGLKNIFGHIDLNDANRGGLKLNIDGFGNVDTIRDLVRVARESGVVAAKDIRRLEKLAHDAETTGLGMLARKGGGTNVPPEVAATGS